MCSSPVPLSSEPAAMEQDRPQPAATAPPAFLPPSASMMAAADPQLQQQQQFGFPADLSQPQPLMLQTPFSAPPPSFVPQPPPLPPFPQATAEPWVTAAASDGGSSPWYPMDQQQRAEMPKQLGTIKIVRF